MSIRIVNLRGYKLMEDEILIKVDRSSVLGNVYKMRGNSNTERNRVCDEYKSYFMNKVKEKGKFRNEVIRIYRLVRDGNDVALGCWCAPKRCHAEVIKEFIESYLPKEPIDNAKSKDTAPILERLSETGNAMEKTYTFETFANDGHKSVCITVHGYCDNSDCNAPSETYIISQRYVTREKAREIYKDCLNAGFKKPWYDKIDWSKSASK